MKKFIITVAFGLYTILGFAHNPDVSTTMLVEKENNEWVLQISASLTAFQQEIKMHFSEYKTPEEFQQMVLEHIINNLDITFNDNQKIALSDGVVKLGHETKVIFEVFGLPSEIKSIVFKNSAFKDISNNQSALVILKEGFNKKHFILNKKNNHTLKLLANDNKFFIQATNEANFVSPKLLIILGVILITGLLAKFVNSKKNRNELQ